MKRLSAMLLAFLLSLSALAQSAPSLTERAEQALFEQSDSVLALQLAKSALKRNRHDAQAAFVAMESSALQADDAATLDAALTVVAESDANDPRFEIASDRINSLAKNSTIFRPQLRRLQKLAAANPPLRFALVSAASDGVPELNQLMSARDSGLVTDWRVAGPFGKNSFLDFDKHFAPESDFLQASRYGRRSVEQFQFITGRFSLPDYFPSRGIYYASSELYITSDGMWNTYLETGGTATIFIDGNVVAVRDERHPAQPQLIRKILHLTQGKHKLLVKFTPSASPFRVAILPPNGGVHKKQNIPVLTASPESEYVIASLELSRGNLVEAFAHAQVSRKAHDSAAVQWLLARCWKQLSDDSPEQESALRSALLLDSSAARVRVELARQRLHSDHTQEGLALLKQASIAAPRDEMVLLTEVQEFSRLAWRSEADDALQSLLAQHPSCSNLQIAATYYSAGERIEAARATEDRLAGCSPIGIDGPQALSRRGEHARAAQLAMQISASRPFDRTPLEFALRELMYIGDAAAAHPVALQLAELAPNADRYQQILQAIERGSTTFDEPRSAPMAVLAPYRRDAFEIIRKAAPRKYSGGPAVWTLNDAVVVENNGARWLYTHRIVRLLNRDGVLNYGEVTVPHGAEVLHLRTIALNGQVAEPEFNQHKSTVSMPALAAGDSIEEEFVQRITGEETRFDFGSLDAPILFSRFTLIASPAVQPLKSPASTPTKALDNGLVASTWEFNDLAQAPREASLPVASQFPSIVVGGELADTKALREHAQEQLMTASVPGARSFAIARELRTSSQLETARLLYRHVMRTVEGDDLNDLSGEVSSAEQTLESHEGSRATTLLALARAAGIDASLLLARELGSDDTAAAYTHPLVEFRLSAGKRVLADVENDGLPFGAIDPQLDVVNVIPVLAFRAGAAELPSQDTVALAAARPSERSTAKGKIEITAEGALHADIVINMAPWRASQMRGVLRSVNAPDRPRFFQQLAMRLFPGATEATGEVMHENDADQPLAIHVVCSAPSFVDLHRRAVEIDQITPALGLRNMYAKSSSRVHPLAIDAVLFESSVFTVVVPEGVTFANGMETEVKSEFGSYATSVRQVGDRQWEMKREFEVPLQIIAPDHYQAFSTFANRIDLIERQRLSLRINHAQVQSVKMDRE